METLVQIRQQREKTMTETKRNQKRSKHRSRERESTPWKIRVYDSSGEVEADEKNSQVQVILSNDDEDRKEGDRAA
jgi:hypothetical protein